VFCSGVSFAGATFEEGAAFEGTRHEVCVARRDFRIGVFDCLLSVGILTLDEEASGYNDYAHFAGIETVEALRQQLEERAVPREMIAEVEAVWQGSAREMFAGTEPISFDNVNFRRSEEVAFLQVNLERCDGDSGWSCPAQPGGLHVPCLRSRRGDDTCGPVRGGHRAHLRLPAGRPVRGGGSAQLRAQVEFRRSGRGK
jgi:hypothetical protein